MLMSFNSEIKLEVKGLILNNLKCKCIERARS